MKSLPSLRLLACMALALHLTPSIAAEIAGLPEGRIIPDFTLTDASGQSVTKDSLLKQDLLAVVFFRSADWCPFCQRHLVALEKGRADLERAGIRVVGISYDPPATLERFKKQRGIGFTLLSDKGSKVIDAFEVRNESARSGRTKGIPHPVVFLVDRLGVIRAKLGYESYRQRPAPDEILQAAKGLK